MIDFSALLKTKLDKLGIKLSTKQLELFAKLGSAILKDPLYPSVSKILQPEEIVEKHFLDSIAPLALNLQIWQRAETIMDIGTGGGFPAFPLAIVFPEKRIFAVDSKIKAISFVKRISEHLGIKNVIPCFERAETIGRMSEFREKVPLVVSRAVGSVRTLIELCLPIASIDGYILLYKGPKLEQEVAEAQKAFESLKVSPQDIVSFVLEQPHLPFQRGYLLINKKQTTPEQYPRRNGVPASNPL